MNYDIEVHPFKSLIGNMALVLIVAICVWGMVQCRALENNENECEIYATVRLVD